MPTPHPFPFSSTWFLDGRVTTTDGLPIPLILMPRIPHVLAEGSSGSFHALSLVTALEGQKLVNPGLTIPKPLG